MKKDTRYKRLPYTVCKRVRKLRLNKRGHRAGKQIKCTFHQSSVNHDNVVHVDDA